MNETLEEAMDIVTGICFAAKLQRPQKRSARRKSDEGQRRWY